MDQLLFSGFSNAVRILNQMSTELEGFHWGEWLHTRVPKACKHLCTDCLPTPNSPIVQSLEAWTASDSYLHPTAYASLLLSISLEPGFLFLWGTWHESEVHWLSEVKSGVEVLETIDRCLDLCFVQNLLCLGGQTEKRQGHPACIFANEAFKAFLISCHTQHAKSNHSNSWNEYQNSTARGNKNAKECRKFLQRKQNSCWNHLTNDKYAEIEMANESECRIPLQKKSSRSS